MTILAEYSSLFWILAIFVALLIGIDKSGFGGGISVVATPLIALSIPVAEAAALVLPVLIFGDILAFTHYRRRVDGPNFKLLLPCLIAGVIIGTFFFQAVVSQKRVLEIGIALIALGFVAFQLSHNAIFKRLASRKPSRIWGIILGTLAGFTSMIAHVGGPLVTIYLLPQGLPRDRFVGTSVLLFFITNLVKLLPYGLLGLLHIGNFLVILLLLPFTLLGTRLGIILNRHFSEIVFSRFIYLLLVLTGIQLLVGKNLMAALVNQ